MMKILSQKYLHIRINQYYIMWGWYFYFGHQTLQKNRRIFVTWSSE